MTRFPIFAPVAVILLLGVSPAEAQWIRDEPVRLFDGRLRIAGDVSATFGARDDDAFFNFTDYERNALRTFRAAATAEWRPAAPVAVIVEVRSEDFEGVSVSAAYVRVRPSPRVPFDVQAGRIPPVFGSFGRRRYATDQPLIGYPLAYQYLTSLRPDALPATADDLLRMRGRGWRSDFPVGSPYDGPGMPLISAFRWDTGVQARWASATVEAAMSVTQGTLSNPRLRDDNDSLQVAFRGSVQPIVGLVLGGSAARGGWISDSVPITSSDGTQTALGADVEYSAGRWIVRTEAIWSRWNVPFARMPTEGNDIKALAVWAEGRYRMTPRFFLAGRVDRLAFSRLTSTAGSSRATWDAGVRRLEAGAGYYLQRNVVVRGIVQANDRDGGRVSRRTFVSSQVAWWF